MLGRHLLFVQAGDERGVPLAVDQPVLLEGEDDDDICARSLALAHRLRGLLPEAVVARHSPRERRCRSTPDHHGGPKLHASASHRGAFSVASSSPRCHDRVNESEGVEAMSDSRMEVVVAGAGVAGLETALALNAVASEYVTVELIAPERNSPIGRSRSQSRSGSVGSCGHRWKAASPCRGRKPAPGCSHRRRCSRRRVALEGGEERGFDSLVLALGAQARESVSGSGHVPRHRPRARVRDAAGACVRRDG